MRVFNKEGLKKLKKPALDSTKGDNGQVTIIGGSKLFHGSPLFALKTASRIVDMVFFASPEPSVGKVAEDLKSKLLSFIWIPWEEADEYVKKSDAALIGSGFMRFHSEKNMGEVNGCDEECQKSAAITKHFLTTFPDKHWVIDAGSLQVLDPIWIPKDAILTPNKKEYKMLFGDEKPENIAKEYKCILVLKGPITHIYSEKDHIEIKNGNPGLTKGGSGDVESGLTAAFLTKNDPLLSASAASFVTKKAADILYKKAGTYYSSEDLADKVPEVLFNLQK